MNRAVGRRHVSDDNPQYRGRGHAALRRRTVIAGERLFLWAYTIAITNNSAETVQLKTRHWRITDANGRRQEVRGAGVVGEEPVLKSGDKFEYTSGVPLQTPSGFMVGTYGMVSTAGEHFDIDVPAFSLDSVESRRTIN